ncbi:unnamed protein product, partial [Timema podura]|nr:unnamed protein product [Timema podura]
MQKVDSKKHSMKNNLNRLCALCRNHGLKIPVKGHKRFCAYKLCVCRECCLVKERQRVVALHLYYRRAQEQEESDRKPDGRHALRDRSGEDLSGDQHCIKDVSTMYCFHPCSQGHVRGALASFVFAVAVNKFFQTRYFRLDMIPGFTSESIIFFGSKIASPSYTDLLRYADIKEQSFVDALVSTCANVFLRAAAFFTLMLSSAVEVSPVKMSFLTFSNLSSGSVR